MRHHIAAALVAASGVLMSAHAHAADARGGVTTAVEAYFHAVDHAREAEMPRAFHPSALMFYLGPEGQLTIVSQPDWRARMARATAANPAQARKVGDIIVDGDRAIAFATATYPGFEYLDALLLASGPDGWRIVAKVFHKREPRDKALTTGQEGAVREAIARHLTGLAEVRELRVLETVAAARVERNGRVAHALLVRVGDEWRVVSVSA